MTGLSAGLILMIKRITILFLTLALSFQALPQSQDVLADTLVAAPEIIQEDTQEVKVIEEQKEYVFEPNPATIPIDTISAWRERKEFAYMATLDSALREYQKKEDNQHAEVKKPGALDNLFSDLFFRVFMWSIAGIAVLFILYRLFSTRGIFERRKRTKTVEEELTPDEQFLENDFDKLIADASASGNYRLATRYCFIKTLKLLDQKSLISFSIDKTNSRYIAEIKQHKTAFTRLARHYEYIWFGKIPVSESRYKMIFQQFKDFNAAL